MINSEPTERGMDLLPPNGYYCDIPCTCEEECHAQGSLIGCIETCECLAHKAIDEDNRYDY